MKLTATKSFRYNTRRLLPGDVFDAKPVHGRLLIAVKKAKENREVRKINPPPPVLRAKIEPFVGGRALIGNPIVEVASPEADDVLTATRAEYSMKLGRKPFHGWDVEELRRRISEAE